MRLEKGRVVALVTDAGEIDADSLVLACGAWFGRITKRLGLNVPVAPGKGYHLDIDRPERCPEKPIVLFEEKVFVEPLDDFLRLAGTMELSGFNFRQVPIRLEMLKTSASRYLSGIEEAHIRSRWCHLRPMSSDGLPVIGRSPRADNAWIATGHGMLGHTQGPITGKLLAEDIIDGRTSIDLMPLSPTRF